MCKNYIIKSIHIILFIISIFSANAATVKVEGKISTMSSNLLQIQTFGLPFQPVNIFKVPIQADGTFSQILQIPQEGFYILRYDRHNFNIYLMPDQTLRILFDNSDFYRTLKFEDTGSIVNQYLLDKRNVEDNRTIYDDTYFSMKPSEFEEKSKQYKALLEQPLNKFKASVDAKKYAQFFQLEENDIQYKFATLVVRYPASHAFATKKNLQEVWQLADWKSINSFDLSAKPELLLSKTYRDFLNIYLYTLTDKKLSATLAEGATISRVEFIKTMYALIGEFSKHEAAQHYLKARVLFDYCNQNGINNLDNELMDFAKNVPVQDYQRVITDIYKKWQPLKTGSPAPEIAGNTPDGKMVKLSDFKGKVVYIDVWATWCGPCLRELPFLEQLQEDYKAKDIVFLSVSIDNTADVWTKFVAEKQMKGVQIFNAGGWGAEINKKYLITGIPRFLLIDKQGNISNVHAERPSSPNIRKTLDTLLTTH